MNKKTRKITLSAIFATLAVICLYLSSVLPTGQLGIVALASLFTAGAVVEEGLGAGISVFAVSSVIGALILPNKGPLLLYVLFFGYYPIIKSIIERLGKLILEWAIKLIVFNAALSVIWLLLRELVFDFSGREISTILIYIGGNTVFALFDFGFTKLIWLYVNQISKNIRRK